MTLAEALVEGLAVVGGLTRHNKARFIATKPRPLLFSRFSLRGKGELRSAAFPPPLAPNKGGGAETRPYLAVFSLFCISPRELGGKIGGRIGGCYDCFLVVCRPRLRRAQKMGEQFAAAALQHVLAAITSLNAFVAHYHNGLLEGPCLDAAGLEISMAMSAVHAAALPALSVLSGFAQMRWLRSLWGRVRSVFSPGCVCLGHLLRTAGYEPRTPAGLLLRAVPARSRFRSPAGHSP